MDTSRRHRNTSKRRARAGPRALLVEDVHNPHRPLDEFERGLRVREVDGRPGHAFLFILRLDRAEQISTKFFLQPLVRVV